MDERDKAAPIRLFEQPPPPCERGCEHRQKCSRKLIACHAFRRYVLGPSWRMITAKANPGYSAANEQEEEARCLFQQTWLMERTPDPALPEFLRKAWDTWFKPTRKIYQQIHPKT